jgi:hypothetical protein
VSTARSMGWLLRLVEELLPAMSVIPPDPKGMRGLAKDRRASPDPTRARDPDLCTLQALDQMPEARLREHFVRLMSPGNMFVVPSRYGGLGGVPEFCEELQKVLRRR